MEVVGIPFFLFEAQTWFSVQRGPLELIRGLLAYEMRKDAYARWGRDLTTCEIQDNMSCRAPL